jgi:hypothetical protein
LSCIKCDGILDIHARLCCPFGSYIYYTTSGIASCRSNCPTSNIYKYFYCCDSITQQCSNTYQPTLCNPAIYIFGACQACPNYCSYDSQICSTGLSLCSAICHFNEVMINNVGCLKCDPSCIACTTPLNSSGCISCA